MPASKGQEYLSEIILNKRVLFYIRKIRSALATHGSEVKKKLRKTITTGSRSGRMYYFRGKSYTASAPGEPPANRSGKLARSFGYKAFLNQLTVFNNATSKGGFHYPKHLEEVMNRPYFENTIKELEYRLEKDLRRI